MTPRNQTAAQAMQYIDHILRDGATPTEQRDAEAYLLRCRPSRQRALAFPAPVWEGRRRGDERRKEAIDDARCGVVSRSGTGPSADDPYAGSAAAIPGQLVAQEVTEQGTDTHGE